MDMTDARELYFILMNETRQGRRQDAYRQLCAANDADLKWLADSGNTVFNVISGKAGLSEMEAVLRGFGELPLSDMWSNLAEATGQMLILKGLSMKDNDSDKAQMLEMGLRFVAKAQDGGFIISGATAGYANAAGEAKPALAKLSRAIMQRNELLSPKRPFIENPPGFAPRRKGREGNRA